MDMCLWLKILRPRNLEKLEIIRFNGNYGDFICHPNSIEFIDILPRSLNIQICTNGSIRSKDYWIQLSKILQEFKNHRVMFALDGATNASHSKHRINTKFENVLENASTFINSGGIAGWQIISFEENKNDIIKARHLAKQYGFQTFNIINSYGDFESLSKLNKKDFLIYKRMDFDESNFPFINDLNTDKDCFWTRYKQLQIMADGTVWPCCWTAIDPFNRIDRIKDLPLLSLNDFYIDEIIEHDLFKKYFYQEIKSPDEKSFCNKNCPGRINSFY